MNTLKLICVVGLLLFGVPSFAQEVEMPTPPEAVFSDDLPVSRPEWVMDIALVNGVLGVELVNAPFGNVMAEIANRGGFEADVSSSIGQRTLNTKFSGVELKRGILRLLSLIGQKTYFMHYSKQGEIKKIEVYGTAAEAAKKPPPTVRRGAQRPQTMPPGGIRPYYNAPLPPGEREEEGESTGAPYIPPKEAPVFIPPPPTGK